MSPDRAPLVQQSLSHQVRDEFAARILSGVWPPGSMLPNEFLLAQEMSVSLGTIRRALQLLEEDKLLIRKQGRGTFILDQSSDELSARFDSFFDAQNQKLAVSTSSIEKEVVVATGDDVLRLDAVRGEAVLSIRRLQWTAQKPFVYDETRLLLRHWPGIDADDGRGECITSLGQKYGVILSRAIEKVTPVLSDQHVAARLGIVAGSPVLLLERTIFDKPGRKIEWRAAHLNTQVASYFSMTR